jgi:hypothetical protein
MSTREYAYSLIDMLSEEQLETFIAFLRSITDIPNEETQQAMLEADRIAKDPSVKSYTDVHKMFEEILSEDD